MDTNAHSYISYHQPTLILYAPTMNLAAQTMYKNKKKKK